MFSYKNNRGFTLIETFVAVSILMLAVVGPLTIASRGLNTTVFARDQLTATHLAQEAIEYIRLQRDNNMLTDAPSWLENIDTCTESDPCTIDAWDANPTTALEPCSGACTETLKYREGGTPPYTYTACGTDTPCRDTSFVRSVWLDGTLPGEREIAVSVAWKSGIRDVSLTMRDHIFNWAGGLIEDQTP